VLAKTFKSIQTFLLTGRLIVGTGKQSAELLFFFFGWSIWTAEFSTLPETSRVKRLTVEIPELMA